MHSGKSRKSRVGSKSSPMISIAVVSTAEIAINKVIPALQSVESIALVAVSSRDKDRAQAFIDEHCNSSQCKGMDHDEILSTPSIDAVYVPLPSRVRSEFINKALRNKKHVYSEKPHGGTVKELKEVFDLAQKNNLQWIDGTMWYHSNRTKEIENKLFQDCSIGKVKRVTASFTWGGGGLVDKKWVEGGNGRTDPKREMMAMLGDSGHYPISVVAWAFGWVLPVKVQATHTTYNSVGAIIECDAVLLFADGGRAVIDTSCLLAHRSQFELVGEKGVLKVDDLVGGQGRSGNFGAYEGPFVGSSSFIMGDYLGKDEVIQVEPCDHVQSLVNEFSGCIEIIKNGGSATQEWSKRSLITHTIMCAVFESAMRGGAVVELNTGIDSNAQFVIDGNIFNDIPTMQWVE